jgi:hypothetical protein
MSRAELLIRSFAYNKVVENAKPLLITAKECIDASEIIKSKTSSINCKGENDLGHPSIFINLVLFC